MFDSSIKLVLLGSPLIGKSSLVRRFLENIFLPGDSYDRTIGAAFVAKELYIAGKRLLLNIWDTAGQEKYESLTRSFYREAKAAIVCYDMTYAKSWERAKSWVSELRQFEEDCSIYLCGTKLDLIKQPTDRAISKEKINVYVTGLNIKYFETSSKTGYNVVELFHAIANDYLQQLVVVEGNEKTGAVKLNESSRNSCCF